jgi:hypothetical protein
MPHHSNGIEHLSSNSEVGRWAIPGGQSAVGSRQSAVGSRQSAIGGPDRGVIAAGPERGSQGARRGEGQAGRDIQRAETVSGRDGHRAGVPVVAAAPGRGPSRPTAMEAKTRCIGGAKGRAGRDSHRGRDIQRAETVTGPRQPPGRRSILGAVAPGRARAVPPRRRPRASASAAPRGAGPGNRPI